MPDRIASLLDISPAVEDAEIVRRHELGCVLGMPQSRALQLTRRSDFPEPMLSLNSYVPNETLPQPQPIWDRGELERWVKQQT